MVGEQINIVISRSTRETVTTEFNFCREGGGKSLIPRFVDLKRALAVLLVHP